MLKKMFHTKNLPDCLKKSEMRDFLRIAEKDCTAVSTHVYGAYTFAC